MWQNSSLYLIRQMKNGSDSGAMLLTTGKKGVGSGTEDASRTGTAISFYKGKRAERIASRMSGVMENQVEVSTIFAEIDDASTRTTLSRSPFERTFYAERLIQRETRAKPNVSTAMSSHLRTHIATVEVGDNAASVREIRLRGFERANAVQ